MNKWKKGKLELQKYYDLKVKKSTDFKSLIFGLLLTLIVIAPFLLILVQLFKTYFYSPSIRIVLIVLSWFLLMLCNGLSNFFMIRLAKSYYPENPNLHAIDDWAVLLHQTFNLGFGVFTIALIIVFGVI